ncbi:MAG: addiction module protein [Pseudomonadota bacterium]|nr:addiction module protein [Pseudomonadota bacterium]
MRKASPLSAELEEQVNKLAPEEKLHLLRRLIADIDESCDDISTDEISAAWLQEAQRRIRELEDGSVIAIPADEVITKARERLRNVR